MAQRVVVGVDDDLRVRESIARLVTSAGYAVFMFSSAEVLLESEALESAECLITDVRMPGMGGLELQRLARAVHPSLPVILISANVDETLRIRALGEGASGFMYKPFDGEELLSAIERAVG